MSAGMSNVDQKEKEARNRVATFFQQALECDYLEPGRVGLPRQKLYLPNL